MKGSQLCGLLTQPWQDGRYFPDPYPEDRDELDAYVEPHDPPRFLLASLPSELRDLYAAQGEPEAVLDAGIESLEWRNRLTHLEGDWVSQDVFDGLQGLAPNIRSLQSFTFTYGGVRQSLAAYLVLLMISST